MTAPSSPSAPSVPPPPLLDAREARIAVDGVVAIDRITLATAGDRVVLAGDAGALLAAITGVPRATRGGGGGGRVAPREGVASGDEGELPGEAYVAGGTLLLAGKSVASGAHVATMGAAPLDPPLPPRWTAEAYVAWGARLAGAPRGAAGDLAEAALARVGLTAARRKATGALSAVERRALALAQAIVAGPAVLVAEAPLSGLEGEAAERVLRALKAASEGRRTLISVARLDAGTAEGALARGASHLVVFSGAGAAGEVAVEGPPADLFGAARVYVLTVRSNAQPLRAALAARGITLSGGPVRFSASLPAGATTREILEAARAAQAAVVEMVPMIG